MRYHQIHTLNEVQQNFSTYQKFLRTPLATEMKAGFEAELCFVGVGSGEEPEYEADYDNDRRPRSIEDIIDFFTESEHSDFSRNSVSARVLIRDLEENFNEWVPTYLKEQFDKEGEGESRIRSILLDEFDMTDRIREQFDLEGYSQEQIVKYFDAGAMGRHSKNAGTIEKFKLENPDYQKFSDAHMAAIHDLVAKQVALQKQATDAASNYLERGKNALK